MKKTSGKSHRSGQYGEEGTSKLFNYDPAKLVLVEDENNPMYDDRVKNKPDEAMVLNIMAEGVHEPVIVRFNGKDGDLPIVEVVDGRQRTICSREANRRLRAVGKEPVFVPCLVKKADAATLMGIMISTNEIRKDDSPLNRARKLQRYMAMGRTEDQAAVTFGVTKMTIKNQLRLLELHPSVLKRVESGEVPATIARELADIPQEKQLEACDKLIASGEVKGARGLEAAKQVRRGESANPQKSRMLSRVKLEEISKKLTKLGNKGDVAYAVVRRILGHERAFVNYPHLKEAFDGEEEK